MAGTVAGGKLAAAKNLARDPDFYKKIGAKGGAASGTGGFAANPELASIAGARGGRNSRRTGIKNGKGKPRNRTPRVITPETIQAEEKHLAMVNWWKNRNKING